MPPSRTRTPRAPPRTIRRRTPRSPDARHAAGQAGRKAGAEQIVSGACVQHLLAAGDSQLVGHAVHVREHAARPAAPATDAPAHVSARDFFPNAISNTSASGLVCGLWQCSIATAGEPVPPHYIKVLGYGRDHRAHRIQGERIIVQYGRYGSTAPQPRSCHHVPCRSSWPRSQPDETCCHAIT